MNKEKQEVLNWIDEHQDEAIETLQRMIRARSVNPYFEHEHGDEGEGRFQELIQRELKELGAEVDVWEPDVKALGKYLEYPGYDPNFNSSGRPNVVGTFRGTGKGRSIVLMGHCDTVACGTGWHHDPFGGEVSDGKIWGRGAVDMKGGIAAMLMAAKSIIKCGIRLPGDVSVASIIAEENPGIGAMAYYERGYKADACIMTEPTELKVSPLCRGVIWGKLTIEGRSGHIELPLQDWHKGGAVDAIKRARMFLDHFDRLNEEWRVTKCHPLLSVPCQIYVGKVVMGEFISTYANKAEIWFDATYLPRDRDQYSGGRIVMDEIEELIRSVAQTDSWLREHPPVLEWQINADCAETPSDHPIVATMLDSLKFLGLPPVVEGCYSHTDMGWIERAGIPIINFGPGDPRVAHKNDEYVEIKSLLDCTKAIALTILEWCSCEKD